MHTSVTAALYLIHSELQLVRCLQSCFHDVLIIIAAALNSSLTGVYLALRGVHITNNSNINTRDIGNNPSGALQCITDNLQCCTGSVQRGEWYQPNGALVQGTTSTTAFYRTRGANGEVFLNRPRDVESPTGRFCCEVPDITNTNQILCVNIGKHNNISPCNDAHMAWYIIIIVQDCPSRPLAFPLLVRATHWSVQQVALREPFSG